MRTADAAFPILFLFIFFSPSSFPSFDAMLPCHRAQAVQDFKDLLNLKDLGTWKNMNFHKNNIEEFKI